jgi:hypothetical protein
LKPLRQIRYQTQLRNVPALELWELWPTEHGFDVQACYVLELFVQLGRSINPANAEDSSGKGCLSFDRKPSIYRRLFLLHDQLLVEALPRYLMTRPSEEVLKKKFGRSYAKLQEMSLPPHFPALIDLRFQPALVALTLLLSQGSDKLYTHRLLSGKPYYIQTEQTIMHPTQFKPGRLRQFAPWLAESGERHLYVFLCRMIDEPIR